MTFSFSIVYHGKQGLDTFDDGRVNGIYSLKLNQEAVHISVAKKSAGFCGHVLGLYLKIQAQYMSTKLKSCRDKRRQCTNNTSAKMSISLLIFNRIIKGGRDANVSTLQYHEL